MARALRLLVTCEHGGPRVPAEFRALFAGHERLLTSHAGYDRGALACARDMAAAFAGRLPTRLFQSTVTRLLVDLNRSVGHPRLHGVPVRALDAPRRAAIVARYHAPYRAAVEAWVGSGIDAGACVVHVACHSFTPVLDGRVRAVDVGLLFDPRRAAEAALARAWRAALTAAGPPLRIRFNQPYRGTSDGLTTTLRRSFADGDYVGLELEVNQALATGSARAWRALRRRLVAGLGDALGAGADATRRNRPRREWTA